MLVGFDESGTFGRNVRVGAVSCEEELEDLVRLYITASFGNPYPPKGQTDTKSTAERKLLGYLERDRRMDWRIFFLDQETQFQVAQKFHEFESAETADVIRQALRRVRALDKRLFLGFPAEKSADGDLAYEVNPSREDTPWKSAVAGWWFAGKEWMERHQKYLLDARRPDRFTKALAYLSLARSPEWSGESPQVDFFVDGGAPMTFWAKNQTLPPKRFVHGITNGDETHALVTAADRICRAFPKMREIPSDHVSLRRVEFAEVMDGFDELRKAFKDTIVKSAFRDLIIVERSALPKEAANCLADAVSQRNPRARIFPELIRAKDVRDFIEANPQAAGAARVVVARHPDVPGLPHFCERLTPDYAWKLIESRFRELQRTAEETRFSHEEQRRVKSALDHARDDWKKALMSPAPTGQQKLGEK